jgi:putative copper export protein
VSEIKQPSPLPGTAPGVARRAPEGVVFAAVREKLTILNAFVHDVATGTWIGTLVLLSILHHETAKPAWILAGPLVPGLERRFLVLTWVSLAVIVLTGVFRMLTWKVFGWTGDVERDRIRLLKVKHALLGIVFAAGTAWQVALVYR